MFLFFPLSKQDMSGRLTSAAEAEDSGVEACEEEKQYILV